MKKNKIIIAFLSILLLGDITPTIASAKVAQDSDTETVMTKAVESNEDDSPSGLEVEVNELEIGKESIIDELALTVSLPEKASSPIEIIDLENEEDTFSVQLPEEFNGDAIQGDNTALYKTDSDSELGLQNTDQGFRALVKIDNENANNEYKFTFNLNPGQKLMTAAEYLGAEFDTGEVYIVNEDNIVTSIVDPAWAKDANGESVNTTYKVDGNELTQYVEFDSSSAFPIVADPNWGKITRCVGSLSWMIGSSIFAVAKIVKIKKYIQALGGLKVTAQLLVGATTTAERLRAGGSALINLAAIISGVDGVKKNCF